MCSITEIPSVIESEMQQNLHSLLFTACPTDSVHDVILQVHAACLSAVKSAYMYMMIVEVCYSQYINCVHCVTCSNWRKEISDM